jgi:hypothetical protein
MYALLDLSFEDTGSSRLVEARCFEDMCCVDPIIASSSHHTVAIDLELVNRDLC